MRCNVKVISKIYGLLDVQMRQKVEGILDIQRNLSNEY
jgi:hypothetical protein